VCGEARPTIDPDVVSAAQRGDEEGLRTLVSQTYPLVRRWTAVHGADASDLEDVTQEVMIVVLRRLSTFRGDSLFTTWLYRITRNAWFDRWKAVRRRDDREASGTEALSSDETPGKALERSVVRERIGEAFRALPPRQREVFDLADVQGFRSAEVARMLGLAPATVRVTLLKARRALRARLIELDPDLAEEYGNEM
jgi:RNA polymerase sigma-70 factor (ECF subfamily)